MMKFLSCFSVLVLSLGGIVTAQSQANEQAAKPKPQRIVNRVAAVVNGRPITSSEVRARLEPYVRELMALYPRGGGRFNGELIKAKKTVLDELIERELVLSDFEGRGMRVPETAIEAEINRRILTHYNGKREELLEHLCRNGMTYSEFRDAVRKESTVGLLRSSRFDRDIPPTPDEIRAEYAATKYDYRDITKDSVRFEKMLLPFETFGDPHETYEEKMERAVQLVESIERGEISFADAAILHSRDEFAAEGGQWPFRRRCDLSVDFANIVFAAPKGKLVGPIPSASGFSIVRVQEIKRATPPSLKSAGVKARVEDSVRRKKTEERYREWIKRLRDKAVIREYI